MAIEGFAGVTAIDTSVAAVTVSTVDAWEEPTVALIVLVPTPTAVASPPVEMVAAPSVPDPHVAEPVTSSSLLSVLVAMTANC